MKIAVEGCAHGELEKIYDSIENIQKKENVKIDLLICCGDFQSVRNIQDLESMAVPKKYRQLCTFYKYYSGEKVAPLLTLFIGGNHEASNYLQELPYGGWVAPNIYYLGTAGVVRVAGLRIAGVSGIFKPADFMRGRFERPPYSEGTKRSVYHTRNLDTFRLNQIKTPIDILMSHDWPRGIADYGNVDQLLKQKPYFADDIASGKLGSGPFQELLHSVKPAYWFAAHLHCKFAALVTHNQEEGSKCKTTKFLALDKCLPRRKFLQVLDMKHDEEKPIRLEYDLEWLSILHSTNHLLSITRSHNYMPGPGGDERWDFTPTEKDMDFMLKKTSGDLEVPLNFCRTAPPHSKSPAHGHHHEAPLLNPQTTAFCSKIGVDDPWAMVMEGSLTPLRPADTSSWRDSRDSSCLSFNESDVSTVYSSGCFDDVDTSSSVLESEGSPKVDVGGGEGGGQRQSISLPPPKFEELPEGDSKEQLSAEELDYCDEKQQVPLYDIIKQANYAAQESEDEPLVEDGNKEEGVEKSIKKFKRRNQDIYREKEEGSDDEEI